MMSKTRNEENKDKEIYEAFLMFDKDGSGYITHDELHMVLKSLGTTAVSQDDIEEILNEVDIDGDGRINYEGE